MPVHPDISEARRKFTVADLALKTAVAEKRAAIVAKYDATESNTMRRQPVQIGRAHV